MARGDNRMDTRQIIDKKVEYWKKKLIDLSKRNNLVNYRFTKSKSLQIARFHIFSSDFKPDRFCLEDYNFNPIIFEIPCCMLIPYIWSASVITASLWLITIYWALFEYCLISLLNFSELCLSRAASTSSNR